MPQTTYFMVLTPSAAVPGPAEVIVVTPRRLPAKSRGVAAGRGRSLGPGQEAVNNVTVACDPSSQTDRTHLRFARRALCQLAESHLTLRGPADTTPN